MRERKRERKGKVWGKKKERERRINCKGLFWKCLYHRWSVCMMMLFQMMLAISCMKSWSGWNRENMYERNKDGDECRLNNLIGAAVRSRHHDCSLFSFVSCVLGTQI